MVEARSNLGQRSIPGAEPVDVPAQRVAGGGEEKSKNAKRREAARRKAAAATADAEGGKTEKDGLRSITNGVQKTNLEADDEAEKLKRNWRDPRKLVGNPEPSTSAADEAAEREKKARNLKKKLRQARELKDKKEGGGELLPEQFAKVTKIQELNRELGKLGFDADGEPKENSSNLNGGPQDGADKEQG
jgi:partner of Y14 and mago